MAGNQLDLSSDSAPNRPESIATGRKYVGVQFECCDVYHRIYINRDATAYVGHCPKCVRQIRLDIGPGGTESRIFRAS